MSCLNPFSVRDPTDKTGRTIIDVRCGRCLNCRIVNAYEWSKRLSLELLDHKEASFITLTYNDENLSDQFQIRDIQLFFKRLRKRLGKKILYYLVGEVGPKTHRLHYHAIIFGYWPSDTILIRKNPHPLYTSPELESCWKLGNVSVGAVNQQTINYCSGYITKDFGQVYYSPKTGELIKPFMTCSKRPAIGRNYFDRLDPDTLHERDYIYFNGRRDQLPKYFDRLRMEIISEARANEIRKKRTIIAQTKLKNLISLLGSDEKVKRHFYIIAKSNYEAKKRKTI
nr:MAG: replication initiator protein [Microvirus sp.]